MTFRLVIFLLANTLSLTVQSKAFVKTDSLTLNIQGQISELTTSGNGHFSLVKGDSFKYWLLTDNEAGVKAESIVLKNIVPKNIVPKNILDRLPAPAVDTDSTLMENTALVKDWISQTQWSKNRLILFSENNTCFYDPLEKKVYKVLPVADEGHDDLKRWSDKYQLLIHGTHIVKEKKNGVANNTHQKDTYHASQTGLKITSDENSYITSGFRSEDIIRWSLPEGTLKKRWDIGHWYSSRKITDFSLQKQQIFVASKGGRIELRSLLDAEEVLWDVRPCKGTPRFIFQQKSNNQLFYQCDFKYGVIYLTKAGWKNREIKAETGKNDSLVSVSATHKTNLFALGFNSGKVVIFNVDTQMVEQVISPESKLPYPTPAYVTFMKASKKLLVTSQKDTINVYSAN